MESHSRTHRRHDRAPDPNATGTPQGLPAEPPGAPGRETAERDAAFRRAEERARSAAQGGASQRDPYIGLADPEVAYRAFGTFAENVRDFAIFLMDRDGVITFWGEGARLIKWWTKEQVEGGHLRMLYPDGGSEDGTAESHLEQAARNGEYTGEGQRMRSDGSTFWAGISLTALRDADGNLLGFAKVTRDLTARRAAEAVLRAAREEAETARRQAEDASRTKSLFLATMSHEIRTPINAAMGYADLLDLGIAGPLTDVQRRHLARIRSSHMHLLGIVDEVLDFSRLDAGRVNLARQAGRVGVPIQAAMQMVDMQAQAKGVRLTDSVSGFAADVPYLGDEDRVRQVLVVLLSNSVKFTPVDGRITVSAGTAESPPPGAQLGGPGPWVYVRVEDTGPGIPASRIAAIFEPFEQADMTLTRQHGGTGLGLTIAKRLARLMDGDLTVRSELGTGTTFFLWLPAALDDVLGEPVGRNEPSHEPGPGLLHEVRDALLMELERILHAYVARLRSDPAIGSAHALTAAELEDHLASFLADLAETFRDLDLTAGAASHALHDGTSIQRTVAERHGAQRHRLGWTAAEVEREFEILRQEVRQAIERRAGNVTAPELAGALDAVDAFISSAEIVSLSTLRELVGSGAPPIPPAA